MASAGASGLPLTGGTRAARQAAVFTGASVETAAGKRLEHQLGDLAEPYRTALSARLPRAALEAVVALNVGGWRRWPGR